MHIVDVSGTTNEKGQATEGYDPINDIDWLVEEITTWVFNNVMVKWPATVRKHVAAKHTAVQTFQVLLFPASPVSTICARVVSHKPCPRVCRANFRATVPMPQ